MGRGSCRKVLSVRLGSRTPDRSAALLAILTLLILTAWLTPLAVLPPSNSDAFPVLGDGDGDDDEARPVNPHSLAVALPASPQPLLAPSAIEAIVSPTASRIIDRGVTPRRSPRGPPFS